ncbi:ABC transporter permease [Castellaniella sp. GW247-6E4]|uniref:ABC transporter permease n=1 Tax=Castellaniella sp. GW247-6E4 TaxID=3140380 RepID=UPI0033146952
MARKSNLHVFLASWSNQFAVATFLLVVLMAIFAPWLWTQDPTYIDAVERLQGPSVAHWLGTDDLGRDLYSRIIYGSRVSLLVGIGVLGVCIVAGVLLGAVAGYFRALDGPIMRTMDGIMAIPAVLLAIALVSLSGASMGTVIIGIAIPEIPRVTRLVRSVMLSVRVEPYVEAAVTLGTPAPKVILRHMLPNAVAPLIVQGTFIFAHAVLLEAILSFLGAGVPPEVPSWGNIVAQGRSYFQLLPGLVLYPGIVLSLSILAINIIGDAARDALDPRLAARN